MTRYPKVGALAVMERGGAVLMVRRGRAPAVGLWGFPGGHVEWGETARDAAIRELAEETGVTARAGAHLGVIDAIGADHHYLLVATLCHWQAGEPVAGDDADEALWVPIPDVARYETVENVDLVLRWLASQP
ncbi:MAG: NUDIX hydrolase [Pseudomonadota bacterium]